MININPIWFQINYNRLVNSTNFVCCRNISDYIGKNIEDDMLSNIQSKECKMCIIDSNFGDVEKNINKLENHELIGKFEIFFEIRNHFREKLYSSYHWICKNNSDIGFCECITPNLSKFLKFITSVVFIVSVYCIAGFTSCSTMQLVMICLVISFIAMLIFI